MQIPLVVALIYREWNPALDFVIGSSVCFIVGFLFTSFFKPLKNLTWMHGMVVASFSWLVAMVVGALPSFLSGHYLSYLDAGFDLMSGYTTTGLFLLQDLDHVSNGLNMWRHLATYVGGQGMIVVALTFLVSASAGAVKMYVGEGKDEKLLPNVVETARAIWLISLIYLFVGSFAIWIAGIYEGMAFDRAFLHGIWLFMGAWSTGGFAPQSQNLLYYHSLLIEIITMIIFIIGSFNFAVHYAVWMGDRKEIYRNIELVSFFITVILTFTIVVLGLIKTGIYPDALIMFRKGFYNLVSGHTTTGNQTIYARQFIKDWGPFAMVGITVAMAIGASACSTGGGFKGLRMGIIFKGFIQEMKKVISPESTVVVQKIHHIKDIVLDDKLVRGALFIVLCYIFIYGLGAVVGVFYGYPIPDALFDSVSAGSNTGLSAGVTSAAMPVLLKIVYIFEMWAGRLEFMSVFALGGFIVAGVRGK
ncbi:MAG: TrkH family potassium uptake protein [Actinobacteria bacterium]|nr:TrkH family potassium uptake protein [Actinomycetota bacterium]